MQVSEKIKQMNALLPKVGGLRVGRTGQRLRVILDSIYRSRRYILITLGYKLHTTHSKASNYKEKIVRAGDRAAKVVRGLLDFARQTQYEFKSADLNDSIMQALSLVSYQFSSSQIDVNASLAENLPYIEASWEHLQSVWLNLFINARDALQETSGKRRMKCLVDK